MFVAVRHGVGSQRIKGICKVMVDENKGGGTTCATGWIACCWCSVRIVPFIHTSVLSALEIPCLSVGAVSAGSTAAAVLLLGLQKQQLQARYRAPHRLPSPPHHA
jgi:hypothetical protein